MYPTNIIVRQSKDEYFNCILKVTVVKRFSIVNSLLLAIIGIRCSIKFKLKHVIPYITQARTVAKFHYELSNKEDTRNLLLSKIKRNIRKIWNI